LPTIHREEEKEGVSRISFSLQPRLQKELDRVSKLMGYDERSKALQIAIQNFINEFELKEDPDKSATGTILILYEHDTRNIDSKITDIGHIHRLVIVSSLHQHLDGENCLNIIVVRGKVRKILELEQDVRKLSGVKQLKYAYLVVGR
jgi:CopG family nickel-responsive transcriptional regulator